MTNNQNVLENFGGVDAISLCQLLNNNDDNETKKWRWSLNVRKAR